MSLQILFLCVGYVSVYIFSLVKSTYDTCHLNVVLVKSGSESKESQT